MVWDLRSILLKVLSEFFFSPFDDLTLTSRETKYLEGHFRNLGEAILRNETLVNGGRMRSIKEEESSQFACLGEILIFSR